MPNVYAFIPARAGSNRLKSKNTKLFHGKPLYHWTVELVKQSNCFDSIFLSTDIEEIISCCEEDPEVVLVKRSTELATDHSTLLEVIQDFLKGHNFSLDDILILLPVTAPLRVTSDIEEALKRFKYFDGKKAVVSVSENTYPPALMWHNKSGLLYPLQELKSKKDTRKQNHDKTYAWNDILVCDSVSNWLDEERTLFGQVPAMLEVSLERSMPIDYPVQFLLAEALFPPKDERRL